MTTTDDEMRAEYAVDADDVPAALDEWDAWLTAHDARVRRDAKAEAWNECVRAAYTPEGRITHGPNPYETGDQA